ncbi:MAG TPA: hypothetical protein VKF62_09085, partial [Planctomycetota bacterium]|nr:hypothetical protein [Planctomycetota bacterium]
VVLSGTGPGPCQNPFTTGPMAVPAVSVTNCAGRVVLSNLDIRPGFLGRGIQATSSAGLILDHLIVATSPFTCGTPLFPCCEAPCFGEAIWTAGADVSLNDSSVLGIAASSALQVDGPAQALVARTALQGAEGVTVSPCGISGGYVGLGGGDGLEATSGAIVRISAGPGALAAGGDGAQGSCTCPTCVSGPGGHAIFASAASVLRAPDLPLLPGPGAGSPPCNGAPGSGSFGSTVTVAASPLPSLGVVPVLASPGGAVGLDVRGARGSLYVVGAADAPGFQSIAGVGGPLLLDPATLVVAFSGTLGPSGSAAIFTAVPPDPSISTAVLFLQPATMDPSGVSLGPAVPFVVL